MEETESEQGAQADHRSAKVSPIATERESNTSRMPLMPRIVRRFKSYWAGIVLTLIVLSAAGLSAYWVFKVPMLQNPDEDSHIDYAFSIHSAGRLLNARRAPSQWNVHAQVQGAEFHRISHQYTLYLIEATDFQRIRYHQAEKVPAGYGSLEYFRTLDQNAPRGPAAVPDLSPQDNPWLMMGYPFGYYTLVAVWVDLLSLFSDRVSVLFFGARMLSVLLLAGSLILGYGILRELRLTKIRSLALVAAVGFFPVVTFVSAAVQPDILSFFLSTLCFYCALRLRRPASEWCWLLVLGIGLGALIVTKYHFFLLTGSTVAALIVCEHIFRRLPVIALLRKLTILFLPAVIFFSVQVWVYWGRPIANNFERPKLGMLAGIQNALADFFAGGLGFDSWWGVFGWTDAPLIIGSPAMQDRILRLLVPLTLVILALTLLRLEQLITRLILLARRGRWRWALRIAFSNPVIISHFFFTVFIILLYAVTDNLYVQGRYWVPYTWASFLIAVQYAPRALTHGKTQRIFAALVLVGLILYSAIGSYYSIKTIRERYYTKSSIAENAAVTD